MASYFLMYFYIFSNRRMLNIIYMFLGCELLGASCFGRDLPVIHLHHRCVRNAEKSSYVHHRCVHKLHMVPYVHHCCVY